MKLKKIKIKGPTKILYRGGVEELLLPEDMSAIWINPNDLLAFYYTKTGGKNGKK